MAPVLHRLTLYYSTSLLWSQVSEAEQGTVYENGEETIKWKVIQEGGKHDVQNKDGQFGIA